MTIIWCPQTSLIYSSRKKIPNRLPELFHQGVNIAMGADISGVSGFSDQIILAYFIAQEEGVSIASEDLLSMQTINGAKALFMGDLIGSLEPSKYADIVIHTNTLAEAQPRYNRGRQQLMLSRS